MTDSLYRIRLSFEQSELPVIKTKMLDWLEPFSIFIYLDNNSYSHAPNRFEALAATGTTRIPGGLPHSEATVGSWHFGHIAYDYKNTIEPKLGSRYEDHTGFNDIAFFRADVVAYIPYGSHELVIESTKDNAQEILTAILSAGRAARTESALPRTGWQSNFSYDDYIATVQKIREHITEGDCYELNLCVENHLTHIGLDPAMLFRKLNKLNPSPFAALYRNDEAYLICASPERFLWKEHNTILSQPIKGTAKRGGTEAEDELLKKALQQDEKERAENIMIVDLVRNDLAKSCVPGSVSVPELFGVYAFPQVHQLISTIKGSLKQDINIAAVIRNAFPMGSMTGAPKIMVMQLADQYERSRRGIYSGTVGYITPEGDFDFNVVIRSLVYNKKSGYLSYHSGGAITFDSSPEKEWEEIQLKAAAMKNALQ